ncbi:hypothetical protein [Pyrobaculum calidifontis]|uniref:Uncharacterized protein n=1 Tax=Pyrobaculum calidifontis (strain DSM 21063 / JCM 11548 / VA1) TaxID=410359 RepID=A3MSB9_PYRCJ|nr:hypothetical protein [Pyrobaculum calidifontis]ABO07536.1 conserved hypothetical protein [Pyrobaculum calidifontis JCM 11548]
MTSLEVAVILALVLVVAIAVGGYIYTAFATARQPSGVLVVQEAKVYEDGSFELKVVPQVVGRVEVLSVEIAGIQKPLTKVVTGPDTIKGKIDVELTPGQVVSGRVILGNGAVALFTATVQPK